MKLDPSFYTRSNVVVIARELLGKVLSTKINGLTTSGMIVETEAYSEKEKGCHAYKGMTQRNAVMYDDGGVAYLYLCYGIHQMVNVVTNTKGIADAVLIRALEPMTGMEVMMERMNVSHVKRITSGPGKLTRALGIDKSFNGKSLAGKELWIEDCGMKVKPAEIIKSPRIGIDYAGDDALLPWRFTLKGNEWISKM
ncbi:MAG: DNA-3-methyladenine glycosylase [Bacteroidetes bacterium]|nr:DNA-3-methyladenine glycosylase [Bacteroidota bacterium]